MSDQAFDVIQAIAIFMVGFILGYMAKSMSKRKI